MGKTNITFTKTLVVIAAFVFLASTTVAQDGTGRGNGKGNGLGDGNGPQYFDPETVDTYNGTITEMIGLFCQAGDSNNTGNGMHYVFSADSGETFYAMFGPFWYLEQNDIELEEGTKVKLTGSVVPAHNEDFADHDYLIVTTLVIGKTKLVIRDEYGMPEWAGDPKGGYYKSPNYNGDAVTTVNGEVTSLRTRTRGQYNDAGVELKIRTRDGSQIRAYLGPQYYCENQGLALKAGDRVRIRGSLQGGKIVAQRLRTGDGQNLQLRDRKGNPRWEN
jgi:hypothetical protein